MKLLVWNPAYERHMTDEGEQLQRGLQRAGWALGDPEEAAKPGVERVFVGDPRDWMIDRNLRPEEAVDRLAVLGRFDGPVFLVCKDAWNRTDYQHAVARAVDASGLVHYYDAAGIRERCPWTAGYAMIRTWHSVDAGECAGHVSRRGRSKAILTGHLGRDFYPEREALAREAKALGLDVMPHPGYRNTERHTPRYLAKIAGYKVHVCTTSRCRVALRKIVESVAVGCIPVTDLPTTEILPGIDTALVRVPAGADIATWDAAIRRAADSWDPNVALKHAAEAWAAHDWRVAGERLDRALCAS
ncbi:MAG TPA: hypothetical protein VJP77_05520 [Planctomycetota bacterium]|nr:hypothetical protein [Planctomycetota bacterium]